MKYDDLGSRMKLYEQASTAPMAFKGLPLIARLDGRSFHTFTKGLRRPYDGRLSGLMRDTMIALVDRFQAIIGYVQSDEISLVWYKASDDTGDYPFNGRFQKLDSLLAAFASSYFNSMLTERLPEKAGELPTFDCRSFVVPNLTEAYNCLLWRQQDCTKNAISMAAQSMFSHKQLLGKSGPQMQEMMHSVHGINFNDYPTFFKRGVFARRVKEERVLTEEQLAKIPEQHRPTGPVIRSFVDTLDIWLSKQPDGVTALFHGAPIVDVPSSPVPNKVPSSSSLANLSSYPIGLSDYPPWPENVSEVSGRA